jgi:3-phenylpropionate/trans-cinnamate dioxygenase ferredoxin reductase subunit
MHLAEQQQFVIIGAGQAGGWAAKTLRDRKFSGKIVILGEEIHPPYERPPLSKALLVTDKAPSISYLWPEEKLQEFNIERHVGSKVIAVDRERHEIHLRNGRAVPYDRLLFATGARARRLVRPGVDLAGIHYLRTIEDCLDIRSSLRKTQRLLVVGGGWIGLEVAAAAVSLGVPVTLVEATDQLCGRSLPKHASSYFVELHRARGVDVRLNSKLISFEGTHAVETAVFADGSSLAVSMVVIGIGVEPNTELASACGLLVDNGIVVDESTRTSDPDIFAAGDVASHPSGYKGGRLRLECWHNAQNQGVAAAKAMLGEETKYRELPWFWSDQYDVNFQMLGIPASTDQVFIKGDPQSHRFVQYFVSDNRLSAVAAFNSPRELREAKRMMLGNHPFDSLQESVGMVGQGVN